MSKTVDKKTEMERANATKAKSAIIDSQTIVTLDE